MSRIGGKKKRRGGEVKKGKNGIGVLEGGKEGKKEMNTSKIGGIAKGDANLSFRISGGGMKKEANEDQEGRKSRGRHRVRMQRGNIRNKVMKKKKKQGGGKKNKGVPTKKLPASVQHELLGGKHGVELVV